MRTLAHVIYSVMCRESRSTLPDTRSENFNHSMHNSVHMWHPSSKSAALLTYTGHKYIHVSRVQMIILNKRTIRGSPNSSGTDTTHVHEYTTPILKSIMHYDLQVILSSRKARQPEFNHQILIVIIRGLG